MDTTTNKELTVIEARELETKKWAAKEFNIPVEDVSWYNSGTCYDRIIVLTKASADKVTKAVEGQTVNGGMYHGMELGAQTHYKKEFGHDHEYWDVMC